MRTFILLFIFIISTYLELSAQVANSSYITQSGEKVLQLSITVPATKNEVWKLFTTDEGLKKWIAPVAKIDFKTGGSIWTNYDKNKTFDDTTSIKLGIINYLQYEMLTLKVNLNRSFPEEIREQDKNLQEIIQIADLGKGKIKIISTMMGWGTGDEWDKAYVFFEKGNNWTFNEILNLFKK
jgi:hypothetical protein